MSVLCSCCAADRHPAMEPGAYARLRARELGFDPLSLLGPCRDRAFHLARRRIAAELRDQGHSYPAIGRALGGRHHTTVMHMLGVA